MLWEVFDYELACAELCGRGHYSMRRLVRIVEQDEYDAWQAQQQSYYFSNVRGKEDDPWKGRVFPGEQQPAADTTAAESTSMR
jgi:cytochrome c oxidase subunit 2